MLPSIKHLLLFTFLFVITSCGNNIATPENKEENENAIKAPTQLQYEVVKVYTHDTSAYTQGLEWHGETLVEGTGNYGKSILHKMDANMQSIGKKISLPKELFGEGITIFKEKIYQLTWKEHKVFVYDANTLKKEKELIFEELKARIKLKDQSTYIQKDNYYYYSRTEEDKDYVIYCRKHSSIKNLEEILLDVNKLAEGKKFTSIGAFAMSPSHKIMAYSVDFTGGEKYIITIFYCI